MKLVCYIHTTSRHFEIFLPVNNLAYRSHAKNVLDSGSVFLVILKLLKGMLFSMYEL